MPKEKDKSRSKRENNKEKEREESQLEKAASWIDDALSPTSDDDVNDK